MAKKNTSSSSTVRKPTKRLGLLDEFIRAQQVISGLTTSMPMILMTKEVVEEFQDVAKVDPVMDSLKNDLQRALRAIKRPEDYTQMAQAYEIYAETSTYLDLSRRGVALQRTPGTGQHGQKRPDFLHKHPSGDIYVEVKALEIEDYLTRHDEIAQEALKILAELDARARKPGVHFGHPQVLSGHKFTSKAVDRIDEIARRIKNVIKPEQIKFGPTILVVDLGRLGTAPFGPSALLPVFFHDAPPAESCVSGELWQIALGMPGEQIFHLPQFDGKSNLGGHQSEAGVLREYTSLMAITFRCPRWSEPAELLTIWNGGWDQTGLANPCALEEHQIEEFLYNYSDGLNDQSNEGGWDYRVNPLRPRPPRQR
jgi:nucleotide-binding universal stress UspA family protein